MKFFKRFVYLSLTSIIFIYFLIGAIFYIGYSKPLIDKAPIFAETASYISGILEKNSLHKFYYINFSLFSNDKASFLLNYSKNDHKQMDSITNIIKSGKLKIFEDRFKNYRNISVLENKKEIKAKIKFHGSSITPYLNGFESYTIKSKYKINGYNYFKLITASEMNYFNVFLNDNASFFNLYCEDSGDIVVTNLNGKLFDFFQYSVFDENYIKRTFKLEDPVIIRRRTFTENISDEWHSSRLDDTPYNIDSKELLTSDYQVWESFNKLSKSDQYDPEYVGTFMALLQLFGHPHQITGNNDKWIMSQGKMFPVYRNEGMIIPITTETLAYNNIFKTYYYSSSLENYKKFMTNNSVIYYRNKTFKKIIENRHNIVNSLDSIYNKYKNIHSTFNNNYLKIKYGYNYNKRTLINNIKSVDGFLNSGYIIIYFDGSKLKLKSTRVNPLEISVNNKKYEFIPTKYNLKSGEIININEELLISEIDDISNLTIKDLTLNETLQIEKDYSIIFVN